MTEINPIETTTNSSGKPTSVISLTDVHHYHPPRPVIHVMDGTTLPKKNPVLFSSSSSSSSYVSDLLSKRSETQSPTLSEDDMMPDGDHIIRLLEDDADQRVIPLYAQSPMDRDGSNHHRSIFVDDHIDQSIIPISVEHVEEDGSHHHRSIIVDGHEEDHISNDGSHHHRSIIVDYHKEDHISRDGSHRHRSIVVDYREEDHISSDGSHHHRSIVVDYREEDHNSSKNVHEGILLLPDDHQAEDKENATTVNPISTRSQDEVSRDGSDHHGSILVEENYDEASIDKPVVTVEGVTPVPGEEEKGTEFTMDGDAKESTSNLVNEGTTEPVPLVQPQENEADLQSSNEEMEMGVPELNPLEAFYVQPQEKEADHQSSNEEMDMRVQELNPVEALLVQPQDDEEEADHQSSKGEMEKGVQELNPLEALKLEVGASEDDDELQVSDSEDSDQQEEVEEEMEPPQSPKDENEPMLEQQAMDPVPSEQEPPEQQVPPEPQAPVVQPLLQQQQPTDAPNLQPVDTFDIPSLLAEMKAKSRAQLELLQEKMVTADHLQHKVHDLELRHNKLLAICQAFGRHDKEAISSISKDLNAMLSIVASGSGETMSLDSIMPATPIAEDRDSNSGSINDIEF